MQISRHNFSVQKWIAVVSILLLCVKFIAYSTTHSLAILTDALESITNVVAGFIGLYSLYIASKPKDFNHPYGHGKAEFLSAAVEGTIIIMAGLFILYKAIANFYKPVNIIELDLGILFTLATALVNAWMAWYALRIGKKNDSIALTASGRHLLSDVYSSLGILLGLLLLYITKLAWIDGVVAIIFGCIILFTGYKILRKSVAGIMDEADIALLTKMVAKLNAGRRENWIDLHNLRVIKYGNVLHIDCHLTAPWYFNVLEAHQEIDALGELVKNEFGNAVELFVHADGCQPFSCKICLKDKCKERQHQFEQRVDWQLENIQEDKKHRLVYDNHNNLES